MRLQPATTDAEAVALLDKIATTLAWRGGMVSGYLHVSVGAGNPACRWTACYKKDGYGPDGWADSAPPAVIVDAPTFLECVNALLRRLPEGDGSDQE